MDDAAPGESAARWSELLTARRLPMFALLCLGIWLNAVDTLVTSTIMPSVARDVGGYAYFAWATAGFLLGSILAGAAAGLLAERLGVRRGLAFSALLYAGGCVVSATAGSIAPFLAGRLAQGGGAGFIVGLCYVAVRAHFPERMWSSLFAALSAVWGVATLLGPLVGGLFAAAHLWRGVFWVFAVQAAAFAGVVFWVLPAAPRLREAPRGVPARQLAALSAAVMLIAVAGVLGRAGPALVLVAAGLALLGLALRLNGRAGSRLLPSGAAHVSSPAGLGYATVLCLSAAAIGFSVYGAALLQTRLGLGPLAAGYVVSSESVGWTLTALAVSRAGPAVRPWLIRCGSGAVALGLAGCAATASSTGVWPIVAAGLVMGGGFGLCWSFVSQRILGGVSDGDGAVGSAAIPLMQILGNAVGAALAGVIANSLGFAQGFDLPSAQRAAPILFGAFVPVALLGVAAAFRLAGLRIESAQGGR